MMREVIAELALAPTGEFLGLQDPRSGLRLCERDKLLVFSKNGIFLVLEFLFLSEYFSLDLLDLLDSRFAGFADVNFLFGCFLRLRWWHTPKKLDIMLVVPKYTSRPVRSVSFLLTCRRPTL